MRILALETSGRQGSVATLLGDGDRAQLLSQIILAGDERTTQVLAPSLRSLLAEVGWLPGTIELVAVAVGPGSFTGLRIGVTTAKTMAYAIGAQIMGVNTLAVLAAQAPPSTGPLWAVMDAQRQELFVARFDGELQESPPKQIEVNIVPQDIWLAGLKVGDRVIGPALRRVAGRLPSGVVAVAQEHWQPTASAVGQVAWREFRNGRRDDLWKLRPHYYRPSAAEEKQMASPSVPRRHGQ